MKKKFGAFITACFSLFLPAMSQAGCEDGSNNVEASIECFDPARKLDQLFSSIPSEGDYKTCAWSEIRRLRTDLLSYREEDLLIFSTEINQFCRSVVRYDRETERLNARGELTPNSYDFRKETFLAARDLHCSDRLSGRRPPEGQKDVFKIVNKRLGKLETSSLTLLNDCTSSFCRNNECL